MQSVFDSICIQKQTLLGPPVDLGFLALAMIFYRDVHVVADPQVLDYLLKVCGYDSLKAAISDDLLQVSYSEQLLGVQTDTDIKGVQHHFPGFVATPKLALEYCIESTILESTGKRGFSRRVANSLGRLITKMPVPALEAQESVKDIHDDVFCSAAACAVLRHIAPGYLPPKDPFFKAIPDGHMFAIETNINLRQADEHHRRLIPGRSTPNRITYFN